MFRDLAQQLSLLALQSRNATLKFRFTGAMTISLLANFFNVFVDVDIVGIDIGIDVSNVPGTSVSISTMWEGGGHRC